MSYAGMKVRGCTLITIVKRRNRRGMSLSLPFSHFGQGVLRRPKRSGWLILLYRSSRLLVGWSVGQRRVGVLYRLIDRIDSGVSTFTVSERLELIIRLPIRLAAASNYGLGWVGTIWVGCACFSLGLSMGLHVSSIFQVLRNRADKVG
jgi:hypothetical protein